MYKQIQYIVCQNYRRMEQLLSDYCYQYPNEILSVQRRNFIIIQTDSTLIRLIHKNKLEDNKLCCMSDNDSIVLCEDDFREMYQIK